MIAAMQSKIVTLNKGLLQGNSYNVIKYRDSLSGEEKGQEKGRKNGLFCILTRAHGSI